MRKPKLPTSNLIVRFAVLSCVPLVSLGVALDRALQPLVTDTDRLAQLLVLNLVTLYGGLVLVVAAASHAVRRQAATALLDSLTELPNRALFHDRLQQALAFGGRQGTRTGVILVDLDGFKDVNDTLGHHSGDLLLQEVAARLRSSLRQSDTVARLGGDEFAILLPAISDEPALRLVSGNLLQALKLPYHLQDQTVAIKASLGLAVAPDHGNDAAVLLMRADSAMYNAKRQGSGIASFQLAEPDATRLLPR